MNSYPSTRFVSYAAAISALAGLLFGYDTAVISGAILFIREDFALSPALQGVVVSAVLLGAVVGAALGGVFADRLGRRPVLIGTALTFVVGAFATALAPSAMWLIPGRVLLGAAIGVASFTAPLYISEISPVERRGRLVSYNQIAITLGIVVAYGVDYAFAGTRGWRWMFALAAVPGLLLAIGMFFMPESPRWLIVHGLADKGREVLRKIRGGTDIQAEYREIRASIHLDQAKFSWRTLLQPSLRRPLLIGVGLAIFQQITGINTVIYYAPTILQSAGFTSASAAILATAGVGIVNVLMTVVALQLLDRVGRRPLLLTGIFGMTVALAALALAFALSGGKSLGWISTGSLMVYVGAFAIGLGPVFWLLISEIYPQEVRGQAMSVATVANWGANLVVALTFLTLLQAIGTPITFGLYAAASVAAFVFSFFLVPETKGRSLEAIQGGGALPPSIPALTIGGGARRIQRSAS